MNFTVSLYFSFQPQVFTDDLLFTTNEISQRRIHVTIAQFLKGLRLRKGPTTLTHKHVNIFIYTLFKNNTQSVTSRRF